MALIKCKECGHMISDKASACPNCGCPVERITVCEECGQQIPYNVAECPNCGCPKDSVKTFQEDFFDEKSEKKRSLAWILVIVLLCIIGGGCYYVYIYFNKGENNKDAIVELTPEFIKTIEKYDKLGVFSEGMAAVQKEGKWGYINTKGEEVIPTTLDAYCVGLFYEELAFVVETKNKFSVINTNGKSVFTANYKAFGYYDEDGPLPYYKNGKIYVYNNNIGKCFDIYDVKGNIVGNASREEYDEYYKEDVKEQIYEKYSINDDNDWGLKDAKGNIIVTAIYDGIDLGSGFFSGYSARISNGVVLVILDEIKDGYDPSDGESSMDNIIRHYGYAYLKGNYTFSEQVKEHCKLAEEQAFGKMHSDY